MTDVDRSVDFYTRHIGFQVKQRAGGAIAEDPDGNLIEFFEPAPR